MMHSVVYLFKQELLTMQKQFPIPDVLREESLILVKTVLTLEVLNTIFRTFEPPKLSIYFKFQYLFFLGK